MKYFILTLSDKGSKGEREDLSGKEIEKLMDSINAEKAGYKILPDEKELIAEELRNLVKEDIDLILTTGGTGLTTRDVTPEATLEVIERRIYGMEMAMIIEALKHTPHGMLSRAVVGIANKTLIINLPGSPRAVRENLAVLLPAIPHAVEKINDSPVECGNEE
ncbi:cytoplasmic protein [Marinitoga sp. 1135]|uniref:Molybdenum cofactor synthesis domain protein n=1 Tax=Marinitoga piezophila (strain DSM 14283 / JCM 11233 / KA3) TaxID=443254 RepID=H2J480_MARPK|nr:MULTISPECIES: MogA/MoaB family molybdenum cofactor biosynthesis protein [Marinitoga]AEX85895.1 molybdenum cofactor synthesis domain protein [Marinitoga piezophila KA3]APT76328.1 cytoplasmic protein [Marinitoga sp. 1137]NUU96099.1 cytoplasmic protein [Marinitoga sp. 1135]NUU98006.1 cytoplasmic protein [Marinitoga sp. 1138]